MSNDGNYFVPANQWQPNGASPIDAMRSKGTLRKWYNGLSNSEKLALPYAWNLWARPAQLAPPKNAVNHPLGWKFWTVLAGRGFGKTRLAAEHIRRVVETGQAKRIALVAPTYRDVVQTMIEGESGLLSVFPLGGKVKPRFVKNTVRFERNGDVIAQAFVYTGEEPERLRGPQHDYAWFDELGACKYIRELWLLFVAGHRLGQNPQGIFTTTPRASLLQVNLLEDERTVVTFGKSSDNRTNLAPGTLETLESVYEDTDFAEQELEGRLLLDDVGAIFRAGWINTHRVTGTLKQEGQTWYIVTPTQRIALVRIIVAVDPSGSSKSSACECGIVVVALGGDNNAYVIDDLSKRCTPDEWASIAVKASVHWQGAAVVCEANYGGEMVPSTIRSAARELGAQVKVTPVNAETGKVQRAMLVSPFVQKGRMRFFNHHAKLEKQATTWAPGTSTSPDRMDAMVWGATALLLKAPVRGMV